MTGQARISILIGIQVPAPLAAIVDGWRAKWHPYGLRTIPPHITLLPPMAIDFQRKTRLREMMQPMSLGRKITIQMNGFGMFDKKKCVLFVDIKPDPALTHAYSTLQVRAQAEFGVEPRPRPFHPHITLGNRLSHEECIRIRDEQLPRNFQARFDVDQAIIWEKSGGGMYRPIGSIRLDK